MRKPKEKGPSHRTGASVCWINGDPVWSAPLGAVTQVDNGLQPSVLAHFSARAGVEASPPRRWVAQSSAPAPEAESADPGAALMAVCPARPRAACGRAQGCRPKYRLVLLIERVLDLPIDRLCSLRGPKACGPDKGHIVLRSLHPAVCQCRQQRRRPERDASILCRRNLEGNVVCRQVIREV